MRATWLSCARFREWCRRTLWRPAWCTSCWPTSSAWARPRAEVTAQPIAARALTRFTGVAGLRELVDHALVGRPRVLRFPGALGDSRQLHQDAINRQGAVALTGQVRQELQRVVVLPERRERLRTSELCHRAVERSARIVCRFCEQPLGVGGATAAEMQAGQPVAGRSARLVDSDSRQRLSCTPPAPPRCARSLWGRCRPAVSRLAP